MTTWFRTSCVWLDWIDHWSFTLVYGLFHIWYSPTTHKTSIQLMLISFVWLYMFKCDVYAQVLANQTQKDFWVFFMFLKVILFSCAFSFCSKCIFVFFFKKLVQRSFQEKLATETFPRNVFNGNYKVTFSYKKSHYCLTSISRLNSSDEMVLGKNWIFFFSIHTKSLATVSRVFRN